MNPYTVCESIWPPSAIAQRSYVCVCMCVCLCVNVWCLHLMFARLINSGDVVLRWHIVQASLSPHSNQINTEYHLCTHTSWSGFGVLRCCQHRHRRRARTLSWNCKSVGNFVKITPDFIDKKAITAAFSVQFVFSVSQKNNHGPDFKYPECRYILSKKNLCICWNQV